MTIPTKDHLCKPCNTRPEIECCRLLFLTHKPFKLRLKQTKGKCKDMYYCYYSQCQREVFKMTDPYRLGLNSDFGSGKIAVNKEHCGASMFHYVGKRLQMTYEIHMPGIFPHKDTLRLCNNSDFNTSKHLHIKKSP